MTAVLLPPSQEMIVMTGRTTRIISRDRQIDITGYQKLKGYSTSLSRVFLTLTLVLSSEYSVLGASDPSYRESVSASVIIIITLRSKHREGSNPGIDSLQV